MLSQAGITMVIRFMGEVFNLSIIQTNILICFDQEQFHS